MKAKEPPEFTLSILHSGLDGSVEPEIQTLHSES